MTERDALMMATGQGYYEQRYKEVRKQLSEVQIILGRMGAAIDMYDDEFWGFVDEEHTINAFRDLVKELESALR